MDAREEGELVQGHRPRELSRQGEHEPPNPAGASLLQDSLELGLVLGAPERERSFDRFQRPCSEREEERVVRQLLIVVDGHELARRIDSSNGSLGQGRSRGFHEPLEGKPPRLADAEGGSDGERPVDELFFGREELDGQAVAGEFA